MENIYNYTKFTNVSRAKLAVYPVYFTGNIDVSTAVHRKPRKKYRPVSNNSTDYITSFQFIRAQASYHYWRRSIPKHRSACPFVPVSFSGPLSDWLGQTLLFSHCLSQTWWSSTWWHSWGSQVACPSDTHRKCFDMMAEKFYAKEIFIDQVHFFLYHFTYFIYISHILPDPQGWPGDANIRNSVTQ